MATVDKAFRIKNGLIVEGSTATVNGSNILTEASTEFLQDTAAALITGGTQTNITVTYNDETGVINFAAENGVADSTTDNLTEGTTNLYYTDARARAAVSVEAGGPLSYSSTTGEFDLLIHPSSIQEGPATILVDGTSKGIKVDTTVIATNSYVTDAINALDTDDIEEGATNKYYTDERAEDAAAGLFTNATHSGVSVSYDDNTGTLSITNSGVTSVSGTTNEVEVSAASGSVTIGLPSDVTIGQDLTVTRDATISRNLTVTGDLTVNGSTTTINSTTLSVDDKNIELASTASPTDASADGAGITVKGTTDKTFNWVDATDSWTSSEHLDLASGKEYKINGTTVLSATEATVTSVKLTDAEITSKSATAPTAATPAVVDTFDPSVYSTAKYLVQMSNASGDREVIEVLLTVDASDNIYITEYARIISNTALGEVDARINIDEDVELTVTPAVNNIAVKVSRTLLEA